MLRLRLWETGSKYNTLHTGSSVVGGCLKKKMKKGCLLNLFAVLNGSKSWEKHVKCFWSEVNNCGNNVFYVGAVETVKHVNEGRRRTCSTRMDVPAKWN